MHVVIVGCGRVGTALATDLVDKGHTVAVVDRRPEAFARLGPDFRGETFLGIGFDRQLLVAAGIERADAVAAVTNGDNSNILIARVARETFGIERVVARIYDPARAAIYQRLGISTVATVSWTTERVLRRLNPDHAAVEWVDPTSSVSLVERLIDKALAGQQYSEIEEASKARVVAVTRLGATTLCKAGLVAQEGDIAYMALPSDQLATAAAH